MMLSTCKYKKHTWKIPLLAQHYAVYLYLRTVNRIVAEGNRNYRDGRLIRNKTIGQRFVGKSTDNRLILLTKQLFDLI